MQQEKAKESYKNKNGFVCLLSYELRKQINPFLYTLHQAISF